MIYRSFKDLKLSQLGFGCMRFASDPSTGEIDQAKVNAMFDLAIREGVNYFDTAYPYLGGKSELAMAEGLSRYPRESYYIADKFPGHSLTAPIDNIALFKVSLRKCRTDYFDFYLLHNITEWSVKYYESEEYHILPDMLRMKKEGKIRNLGFSFHGGPELLEAFLSRPRRANMRSSSATGSVSGSWNPAAEESWPCFRKVNPRSSERCILRRMPVIRGIIPAMHRMPSVFCRICRASRSFSPG